MTDTNDWQERTCKCADGHADQRAAYPLDAQVETVTAIYCYGDVIPTGTQGTVVAHCEDGRAYVRFVEPYDVSGAHTFHFPEQNIRVVDGIATPAIALVEEGEDAQPREYSQRWRVAQDYLGQVLIVEHDSSNQDAPLITLRSTNSDTELARFIVNEHNTHAPTLARAVELEALLSKAVGDIERLGFVGADTIELVGLALAGKVGNHDD